MNVQGVNKLSDSFTDNTIHGKHLKPPYQKSRMNKNGKKVAFSSRNAYGVQDDLDLINVDNRHNSTM